MQCDVLVIGAGPAGSSAAYWLARFGAKVILADKAHFPRSKPCGDGLSPGVDEMLNAMGMADVLPTHGKPFRGIHLFTPDHSLATIRFDSPAESVQVGWVIPRDILDDALRINATSAGADFLPGFYARALMYKHSRLDSVFGQQGKRQINIRTHLVIVATGANRTFIHIARLCNVCSPGALATRTYLTGLPGLDEYVQIFLDRGVLPGYKWIFPTGTESANVGCGVILNGRNTVEGSRLLRETFRQFLQNTGVDPGIPCGVPHGYPIRSDFPDVPLSGNGILVAGEAAGLVDPITGEGIALALRSGWLAARVASYALSMGDYSDHLLMVYDDVLRQMFAEYFIGARQFLSWLGEPGVIDRVIKSASSQLEVTQALRLAILEKHPLQGMLRLQEIL
jgi:geranylgeranyl reductase family protein